MIAIQNIRRTHLMGQVNEEALCGIDLHIKAGEFGAVIGPSSSGKSTLMHIIGCLDTPTAGSYVLEGETVQVLDTNH